MHNRDYLRTNDVPVIWAVTENIILSKFTKLVYVLSLAKFGKQRCSEMKCRSRYKAVRWILDQRILFATDICKKDTF